MATACASTCFQVGKEGQEANGFTPLGIGLVLQTTCGLSWVFGRGEVG